MGCARPSMVSAPGTRPGCPAGLHAGARRGEPQTRAPPARQGWMAPGVPPSHPGGPVEQTLTARPGRALERPEPCQRRPGPGAPLPAPLHPGPSGAATVPGSGGLGASGGPPVPRPLLWLPRLHRCRFLLLFLFPLLFLVTGTGHEQWLQGWLWRHRQAPAAARGAPALGGLSPGGTGGGLRPRHRSHGYRSGHCRCLPRSLPNSDT